MKLLLEIPENIVQGMHLPEQEVPPRLRLELAVSLYSQNILSFGKAAELSGLDRFRFSEILAAREISRHYTEEELTQDLSYACGQ
jgi:predicted HTH domain antitoxin